MNCILLYGSNLMPLQKHAGVFRIATELRSKGYSVICIDVTAFNHVKRIDDFYNLLKKSIDESTLWIGFSNTFFDYPLGIDIDPDDFFNFITKIKPDLSVIAGGAKNFDLSKYGVTSFKSYSDKEIVEYTDYCKSKKVTNLKYLNSEITGSEFDKFSESNIIYTNNDLVHKLDTLPIEISRGCIFKCKFCAFPLNGKTKGDWIKQGQILLDELNYNYENFGITHYTYSDDTYNDSIDKLRYLQENVYSKLKFNISFTTYIRLDLMMRFPESIKLMKDSGLKSAMIGIETINPKSAKTIGKGINPLEQFKFVKELKSNEYKDILITSGFIAGLPHDTLDTFSELEEFLFSSENYLDSWYINPLGINPPKMKSKNYYSEFDENYEKYGYEIRDNGWYNKNTDMSFLQAKKFATQLTEKSNTHPNFKFGGFSYNYVRRFGVEDSDLIILPRKEILKKYNLSTNIASECNTYIQGML